ncbi:MAG: hypothetical protein K8R25_01965 [Methanosarcinales archaeon]|nr:hypothetical protein [Methanosarcinales archaeon]
MTQLKDSIGNSQEVSGKISLRKELDIAAVYSKLKETSTNSNVSPTSGEGWITETFYNQDKKIGVLDFLVTNTRVILQNNGHEYTIKIDRLGGVDIEIKLGTKVQIPEEEYRRIFKDMFVNLGLSAEKVDEFKFEYIAGL